MRLALPAPLREVRSPSHRIEVWHETDTEVQVRLATDADLPNRDLVVEATFRQPLHGVGGGAAALGPGGFAVLIPSARLGDVPLQARRVVFVLDRSGSMSGLPLAQAQRAIEACLGACSEEDQFALVAFNQEVETLSRHLQPAGREVRDRARLWLNALKAGGGTELLNGLHAAAKLLDPEGGDLLVLTNGQVAGTENILAALPPINVRLHSLDIGSASQDRFLSQLTRESGGQCRFLTPRERVDLAVLELFTGLASPLARNFRLKVNGSPDAESVRLVGTPPPCLFAGSPLVIQGETDVPARVTLALEWDAAGGPHCLEVPLDLQPHADADVVRQLQGARLITDLESRMDTVSSPPPEDPERRQVWQTLTALSKHDGLASRAQSLFAVVRRPSDQAGEPPRTVVVPVSMPEDTAFASYFRKRLRAAFTPPTPTVPRTDGGVYQRTLVELPSLRQFPSQLAHPLDTCLGTLREEPRNTSRLLAGEPLSAERLLAAWRSPAG